MGIRKKTSAELQAQVATFAAERLNYQDQKYVIDNLTRIALGEIQDVRWTADHLNGPKEHVVTADSYRDFLTSRNTSEQQRIQERISLLNAYEQFAPIVTPLKNDLDEFSPSDARVYHASFRGLGSFSTAHIIEKDGTPYIVRVPRKKNEELGIVDGHIDAVSIGRGVPRLEQIVAASYETGVTVSEVMPGKTFVTMTAEDMKLITDEQLSGLMHTLSDAQTRKIAIDRVAGNIFYDEREGFGIIDFSHQVTGGKLKNHQSLGMMASLLAETMISPSRDYLYIKPETEWTPDDLARILELERQELDVVRRFMSIALGWVTGDDLNYARYYMEQDINALEQSIARHSRFMQQAEDGIAS